MKYRYFYYQPFTDESNKPKFRLRLERANTNTKRGVRGQLAYDTGDGGWRIIFDGDELHVTCGGRPLDLNAETAREVLSWATLRPGDTDAKFFDKDNTLQAFYRQKWAEALSMFDEDPKTREE